MRKYIISGTSKGIGKALANLLLDQGDVSITGIARTKNISHPNYSHVFLDLGNTSELTDSISRIFNIDKDYSQIVLINNAGYLGEVKYAGEMESEDYNRVYSINVTAPAILMNEFIKHTDHINAEKIIINISSGAGRKVDYDGWSAYSSSKAAIDTLTQVIAKERKIRGNKYHIFALAPGVVETQMQEQLREKSESDFSNVNRFIDIKKEGISASAETTAINILKFINGIDNYKDVLQDLRKLSR